jgi:hypothetical protein
MVSDRYEWFGHWPSLHDAEVISLHLNRRGSSALALHTWEMTKDVDDKAFATGYGLRDWAAKDADLDCLHDDPEF